MLNLYLEQKDKYQADYTKLKNKSNLIGFVRLGIAIAFLVVFYYYITTTQVVFLISLIGLAIAFVVLLKTHERVGWQMKLKKALADINENEWTHLKNGDLPFEDGEEYLETDHNYSYDLDIFGQKSLFQYLNRTATYVGKTQLAKWLLNLNPNQEILANQEAIQELTQKLEWRQDFYALAKVTEDDQASYERLQAWSKNEVKPLPSYLTIIAYLFPIALWGCLITYFITNNTLFFDLASNLIIINLVILGANYKRIKEALLSTDKSFEVIKKYGLIIEKIETENFDSKKLKALQAQLVTGDKNASGQIQRLSSLFSSMESVLNMFGAAIFNGLFLYHIHVLKALQQWRKDYAQAIPTWLEVIGEFEALNSLANLAYNNPTYAYPSLNTDLKLDFKELGHPLLNSEKRVCNDITFDQERFVILTGSNMVLGGTGAPICANRADIHPMDVLVSMRLSDSLSDSESYFFAEVKRLQKLMNILKKKNCFVLLDEILRGTNSDDKRTGTIEVIRKIMSTTNTRGVIATHDLEVCNTVEEFPTQLVNKCFEVEIINDNLDFDYKLRDSICQNQSATFLMKKMEVI